MRKRNKQAPTRDGQLPGKSRTRENREDPNLTYTKSGPGRIHNDDPSPKRQARHIRTEPWRALLAEQQANERAGIDTRNDKYKHGRNRLCK